MGLSTKQVSSDHALDWGQTLLESGSVDFPKPPPSRRQQQQSQQQQSEPLKCPRCGSMNTKFCYYNNYNKSQPRHFCKACKRHWTKGGTLRNVPVGGGRKNKRLKISNTAPNTTTGPAANTATKNGALVVAHSPQDCHNFPLPSINDQTKNMSDAFCRALMNNPSSVSNDAINTLSGKNWMSNKNTFSSALSPMLSLPQDQGLQFSFSSLSPFDTIPCPFPSSNLSLGNTYEYTGELDHVESTSTITTVTPATSAAFSHAWQGPTTSSGVAEMPNYWNWNDVDPFVSSDINISWDEI